jgi:hypothetical protein
VVRNEEFFTQWFCFCLVVLISRISKIFLNERRKSFPLCFVNVI